MTENIYCFFFSGDLHSEQLALQLGVGFMACRWKGGVGTLLLSVVSAVVRDVPSLLLFSSHRKALRKETGVQRVWSFLITLYYFAGPGLTESVIGQNKLTVSQFQRLRSQKSGCQCQQRLPTSLLALCFAGSRRAPGHLHPLNVCSHLPVCAPRLCVYIYPF